jgi:magnesium transporter
LATATADAVSPVLDALRAKDWDRLQRELRRLHPSDIAEIIVERPSEDEGVIFRLLPKERAAEVFSYLPPKHQQGLLRSLTNEQVHELVDQMPTDDRARLLEEMPASVTRELLASLHHEELAATRLILGYPEHTAGRYMTPEYATISPEVTAGEALENIRRTGRGKETLSWIYIVDAQGRLVEDVRLESLVMADPSLNVLQIEDPILVCVHATDDRETVLAAFERYGRTALPVTDAQGQMLGIITVDDMLELATGEATKDIQRLGGSEALDAPYMSVGILSMIQKRGIWLSVLFLGEMLTATAMSHFEDEIARAVVLALFVPLIISSGGNSGSQATSIIIRSLALRELRLRDWLRVLRREMVSGIALGSLLGVIGLGRIVLWQRLHLADYGPHYLLVALTVLASLIGVVTFGTLAGSMLPFLLRRIGLDPATSSAPFVATLVDVTGLCIYFLIALLILRGTLL